MLIERRYAVYRTRFQAIKRWGDILQHQHEIYVWLFCKFGAEFEAHVDALRDNAKVFREAVESDLDLEILDEVTLLLDCHAVGQDLINISRGTILMVGHDFKVKWQALPNFSTEDVDKWDLSFRYLLQSLLYVIQLHLTCA